jgi:hypothetical protein
LIRLGSENYEKDLMAIKLWKIWVRYCGRVFIVVSNLCKGYLVAGSCERAR